MHRFKTLADEQVHLSPLNIQAIDIEVKFKIQADEKLCSNLDLLFVQKVVPKYVNLKESGL